MAHCIADGYYRTRILETYSGSALCGTATILIGFASITARIVESGVRWSPFYQRLLTPLLLRSSSVCLTCGYTVEKREHVLLVVPVYTIYLSFLEQHHLPTHLTG